MAGLPTGLIGGLTFSPDGTRLAMNLNTPQTPSDVYSLELGRRAADLWRPDPLDLE